MSTLKFSDGMTINMEGQLRIIRKSDGLYVVGDGMCLPVESRQEGRETIAELTPTTPVEDLRKSRVPSMADLGRDGGTYAQIKESELSVLIDDLRRCCEASKGVPVRFADLDGASGMLFLCDGLDELTSVVVDMELSSHDTDDAGHAIVDVFLTVVDPDAYRAGSAQTTKLVNAGLVTVDTSSAFPHRPISALLTTGCLGVWQDGCLEMNPGFPQKWSK